MSESTESITGRNHQEFYGPAETAVTVHSIIGQMEEKEEYKIWACKCTEEDDFHGMCNGQFCKFPHFSSYLIEIPPVMFQTVSNGLVSSK